MADPRPEQMPQWVTRGPASLCLFSCHNPSGPGVEQHYSVMSCSGRRMVGAGEQFLPHHQCLKCPQASRHRSTQQTEACSRLKRSWLLQGLSHSEQGPHVLHPMHMSFWAPAHWLWMLGKVCRLLTELSPTFLDCSRLEVAARSQFQCRRVSA